MLPAKIAKVGSVLCPDAFITVLPLHSSAGCVEAMTCAVTADSAVIVEAGAVLVGRVALHLALGFALLTGLLKVKCNEEAYSAVF